MTTEVEPNPLPTKKRPNKVITMFKDLHKSFERAETDLNELQKKPGFSRYLLVRSLGSTHLQELIKEATDAPPIGKPKDLYKELYESKIKDVRIIEYIRAKYPEVKAARQEQEAHLPAIIEDFGEVKCGVRNDNLNDVTKELVRDKTIETKADLQAKVNELLSGTVNGYILWQYYNQVTNDLIEHIFNDHPSVIPTLRKIKYVDFMVKIDDEIVPFDLKITHISDDYFDLLQKGLTPSDPAETGDDFAIGSDESEVEIIKKHYKSVKNELELANISGLKKTELVEILKSSHDKSSVDFVKKIIENRGSLVKLIEGDGLRSLEWWNYKFQGERLFKNNNRFFVFLTYTSSFEDARPLKGNLQKIREKVNTRLNTLGDGKFNVTHYHYTKDPGLTGNYVVNSTSVLVTD